MLLREKMQSIRLSNNEKAIIDFVLEKEELIKDYTINMIAEETYTSPSTLIRVAKKLGFNGWHELKESYLKELKYLMSHFVDLDANYPFSKNDSIMKIANKIRQLHTESCQDTLELLMHDDLQKAIRLIDKCQNLHIFAIGNLCYAGEEFAYKMNRINKRTYTPTTQSTLFHDAAMLTKKDCAICISYSGETADMIETVRYLKQNNVPIIAITSLGDNSLSNVADVVLRISTREKSVSKIAAYVSLESISLILDILYSCYFSLKYDENIDYKLKVAKRVESNRRIDNKIISEE